MLERPNFKEGSVLLVDKPLTWTSFDVVNKLRYNLKRALEVKKHKVGHAGTLDPLATGLLIICTGKKTKAINEYMGLPKTYTGTITLGGTTPSYDLETEIESSGGTVTFSLIELQKATEPFVGKIQQLYSGVGIFNWCISVRPLRSCGVRRPTLKDGGWCGTWGIIRVWSIRVWRTPALHSELGILYRLPKKTRLSRIGT